MNTLYYSKRPHIVGLTSLRKIAKVRSCAKAFSINWFIEGLTSGVGTPGIQSNPVKQRNAALTLEVLSLFFSAHSRLMTTVVSIESNSRVSKSHQGRYYSATSMQLCVLWDTMMLFEYNIVSSSHRPSTLQPPLPLLLVSAFLITQSPRDDYCQEKLFLPSPLSK